SDSNSFIAERIASSTFLPVNSLNVIAFGLASSCRLGAVQRGAACCSHAAVLQGAAPGRVDFHCGCLVDRLSESDPMRAASDRDWRSALRQRRVQMAWPTRAAS